MSAKDRIATPGRWWSWCLLWWWLSALPAAYGSGPFPKGVHRIVFLGNSITYAGQYIVDVEAYLRLCYPKSRLKFINAGLPSETVSGLSEPNHAGGRFPRPDLRERLERVLAQTKPDLVFASYGMNDGIYLPLDEQRFEKFREGITWLHRRLEESGIKIVHLTPPVFDEAKTNNPGYAAVLDAYSEWLLSQRDAVQWEVADVHFPMKAYLEQQRRTNPEFALAKDGVHPEALGHWVMARQLLLYLGQKQVADAEDLSRLIGTYSHGEEILKLVAEKQQLMKDAWLTATGHKRPEMKTGLPLKEAKAKAALLEKRIRALLKTNTRVSISTADGK